MSIILDALRKAELERSTQGKGFLSTPPDLRPQRKYLHWFVWTAAGVFCLILGGFITLEISAWLHPTPRHTASSHRAASSITPFPLRYPVRKNRSAKGSVASIIGHSPRPRTRTIARPAPIKPSHQPINAYEALKPGGLPATLDWHIQVFSWSPNPAQRFVVINMRTYRKGALLPGRVRLVQILRQGILVRDQNRLYLYPHP